MDGSDQHQTLAACKSQRLKSGTYQRAGWITQRRQRRQRKPEESSTITRSSVVPVRTPFSGTESKSPRPIVGSTIMLQKSIVSCPTMTGTPLVRKSAVSRGPDPPHVRRPPHLTASTIPKRRHLGEYRWPRVKGGTETRPPIT